MQTKEHHGGFSWRICLSFVCFLFCLFVFFFFLRPPKFVIADLEIGGGGCKLLSFTSEKTLFESIACSFVGFLRCYEKFQPFDCLSGHFFTRNRSAFLLFWIWSKSCASNRPYCMNRSCAFWYQTSSSPHFARFFEWDAPTIREFYAPCRKKDNHKRDRLQSSTQFYSCMMSGAL